MKYTIYYTNRSKHALRAIEPQTRQRILEATEALGQEPRPPGCIHLKGEATYRIRIGKYRATYTINDEKREAVIHKIGRRESVYD